MSAPPQRPQSRPQRQRTAVPTGLDGAVSVDTGPGKPGAGNGHPDTSSGETVFSGAAEACAAKEQSASEPQSIELADTSNKINPSAEPSLAKQPETASPGKPSDGPTKRATESSGTQAGQGTLSADIPHTEPHPGPEPAPESPPESLPEPLPETVQSKSEAVASDCSAPTEPEAQAVPIATQSHEKVEPTESDKDTTSSKSPAQAGNIALPIEGSQSQTECGNPQSPAHSGKLDSKNLSSQPITPAETGQAKFPPPRPSQRPRPARAAAFEAAASAEPERTETKDLRPMPRPRPLGNKIGSLRQSIFADLNQALSRGPPGVTSSSEPAAATISEPAVEEPTPEALPSRIATRTRGPRRRLPTSAAPQLQTVSVFPLWRAERVPRATAPNSPSLSARNPAAGLTGDTLLTRNNSAVDVAKFVMSSAEPSRQLSRTDLPALSKLVDPAVTGSLQHADAHAAGAHAHALASSGSQAPTTGFLAAMATMPEMFAPPRIQRELQEANPQQIANSAESDVDDRSASASPSASGTSPPLLESILNLKPSVKFSTPGDCKGPSPGSCSGSKSTSASLRTSTLESLALPPVSSLCSKDISSVPASSEAIAEPIAAAAAPAVPAAAPAAATENTKHSDISASISEQNLNPTLDSAPSQIQTKDSDNSAPADGDNEPAIRADSSVTDSLTEKLNSREIVSNDTQAATEVDITALMPTDILTNALFRIERLTAPERPANRPVRKPDSES